MENGRISPKNRGQRHVGGTAGGFQRGNGTPRRGLADEIPTVSNASLEARNARNQAEKFLSFFYW